MMTSTSALSTQSDLAQFCNSTSRTAELKLPIALIFGDPIAAEMTSNAN
ncbi:hypothetical protein [Rhodococcus sp. IEGM 1379]|nr:hypothetical protein [Rhodococcus sp. IEGM 1379]MDI9913738.1 hypothetical protein [Rhodococcus sp. IEGM 1379]